MNIALLYYDGFVEFEVALALFLLNKQKVTFFALEKREYTSYEGQTMIAEKSIDEISPKEIDLLIIPGGNSEPLYDHHKLKKWILECVKNNGMIAGICGGAELLAGMGLLNGRKCTGGTSGIKIGDPNDTLFSNCIISDSFVEVDGPFVTSQGQAYAEFASKLYHLSIGGEQMNEEMAILKWLKNDRT